METPDYPAPYIDRSAGLIFFGILTALLGCICALFVPIMLFSQSLVAKSGAPTTMPVMALAMGMYAALAAALIWLGFGSMMARRWARALILIFSWTWLITGIFSVTLSVFVLPQTMHGMAQTMPAGPGAPSPQMLTGIAIIGLIFNAAFLVAAPAVWIYFYRSPHVKATCEARDAVTRWTDRCPLPVLAVSLFAGASAVSMLLAPLSLKGFFPFFGMFATGLFGSVLHILAALICAYGAWGLYRLRLDAWWLIVASVVLFSVSAVVTYSRHDVTEIYAQMGFSNQQNAEVGKIIENVGILHGPFLALTPVVSAILVVGYMVWIKKFFAGSNER